MVSPNIPLVTCILHLSRLFHTIFFSAPFLAPILPSLSVSLSLPPSPSLSLLIFLVIGIIDQCNLLRIYNKKKR